MITPGTIALITGSVLVSIFAIYASLIGAQVFRWWDLQSGSERQLSLERKTYLISTILAYVMPAQVLSLFFFVYTADRLHEVLLGAMCAAGSLNANGFGYLTLILKTANAFLCGLWLLMNHLDSKGYDYPLIRDKYRFLFWIAALLTLEAMFQTSYLLGISPDVLTSCCGTLFSSEGQGLGGEMAAMPSYGTKIAFYLSLVLVLRAGIHFLWTKRGARAFSYIALWFFLVSMVSMVSFISVYFYELPTHHCPFCVLQGEYHYIGYPLYLTLLGASIAGVAVGMVERFRGVASLRQALPGFQRGLCLSSMVGYILFVGISSYPMIFSDFKLEGY